MPAREVEDFLRAAFRLALPLPSPIFAVVYVYRIRKLTVIKSGIGVNSWRA